MFNWIRTRVRDAFLAGIQDGIDTLAAPQQVGKLEMPELVLLRLPMSDEPATEDAPIKRGRTKTAAAQ